MKHKKKNKNGIIKSIIVISILMLAIILIYTLNLINNLEEEQTNTEVEVVTKKDPTTIKEVIESYGSAFIEEKNYTIYVDFKNNLYNENGESNQNYFEDIIRDLGKLDKLEEKTFILEDEGKKIHILAEYDFVEKKHNITYNRTKDFYSKTNGKTYAEVENMRIVGKVKLSAESEELVELINGGMYFRFIKETIGEGVDLGNGYTSYKDGAILIKMANYRVTSIIFTEKYTEEVFDDIKVGTDLEKIEKNFEGYGRGSSEEGYLMYRTGDVYAFFYENEIVVYGYTFNNQQKLEDYIEEYLNNKDLKNFVERMTKKYVNYDICEYDLEAQTAHITYPSRGIEINITNNDSLGIKLYTNYYLTDRTKEWVKTGKISINSEEDYLHITEKNRRNNIER